MKKKFILIWALLSIVLPFNQLLAQMDNNAVVYDPNRKVFWFPIAIEQAVDKETKQDILAIRCPGKPKDKIKFGNRKIYDQALWKMLNGKRNILIGPFTTFDEAKMATLFYDQAKNKPTPDSAFNPSDEIVYWFKLDFEVSKRDKTLKLTRTAAAVASGSRKEFDDALREFLTQKALLVGPFSNQPDAEEAKRIYRRNE